MMLTCSLLLAFSSFAFAFSLPFEFAGELDESLAFLFDIRLGALIRISLFFKLKIINKKTKMY